MGRDEREAPDWERGEGGGIWGWSYWGHCLWWAPDRPEPTATR